MKENAIKIKSFAFAVRIVRLYQQLLLEREYVMSRQVLRSGTGVGAIIRESQFAGSKADFAHKLALAQKETNETIFWLELLRETDYLEKDLFESVHEDATEIIRLLTSILKSIKSNSDRVIHQSEAVPSSPRALDD